MTIVWLNADQIAERLGVHRRTAMALMMEMNPVPISGNVRKRYRVSEESFNAWMLKRSNGRITVGGRTGTTKRLQRKG